MQLAINQAKNGDYPFGAIIVRDGNVLALGRTAPSAATIRPRTPR